VVLDITINKPVAERTAVSFMREVLRHVDWNAKEYVAGLYCDRAEAKSYIHVVEGLTGQGGEVRVVEAIPEGQGPTYEEVVAENLRLRAALANSQAACTYCALPRAEWNRCQSGFPGCARADDAMGCPELGAALRESALRDAVIDACRVLVAAVGGQVLPLEEDETIDF
jgi:hypothetical protein